MDKLEENFSSQKNDSDDDKYKNTNLPTKTSGVGTGEKKGLRLKKKVEKQSDQIQSVTKKSKNSFLIT